MDKIKKKNSYPGYDCFLACRLRDAPTLFAAVKGIQSYFGAKNIFVGAKRNDVKLLQDFLGSNVYVIDEKEILPEMPLEELKMLNFPFFPGAAGWYYQQLLKFSFAANCSSDYCLIWDADTIPLRPIRFFDENGRVFLTEADEYHKPYFHTIEKLLGMPAPSQTSFISQHIMVEKSILQEMLDTINENHEKALHWSWNIMNGIPKSEGGRNLFSEYEIFANFLLMKYPERAVRRKLRWKRMPSPRLWAVPDVNEFERNNQSLDFIGYESQRGFYAKKFFRLFENSTPQHIKRLALNFALPQGV